MDVLVIMSLFLVKHFLFDYVFQSKTEVAHKGTYGNLSGLNHSGKHALSTLVLLMVVSLIDSSSISLTAAYSLALIDFLTHYHIDWAKMNLTKQSTTAEKKFWVYQGLDQLLHGLVYVGLIALYLRWT